MGSDEPLAIPVKPRERGDAGIPHLGSLVVSEACRCLAGHCRGGGTLRVGVRSRFGELDGRLVQTVLTCSRCDFDARTRDIARRAFTPRLDQRSERADWRRETGPVLFDASKKLAGGRRRPFPGEQIRSQLWRCGRPELNRLEPRPQHLRQVFLALREQREKGSAEPARVPASDGACSSPHIGVLLKDLRTTFTGTEGDYTLVAGASGCSDSNKRFSANNASPW